MGRTDFFAGGNMFVYYSLQQVRNKDYKGPDFFVVKDVDGFYARPSWVVWQEDGRLPDVIVELLSPSTQSADLGEKKRLYERVFRTAEYYCYGPDPSEGASPQLLGWGLVRGQYEPIAPNAEGWLWSAQLGVWVGAWEGRYHALQTRWLRFYDADGRLVLTRAEAAEAKLEAAEAKAEAARAQAEEATARAAALEAEVRRLQALLAPPD
ncbi:MAG: Uma2 family endonuclease [Chloracidobacterium sp.]